jgi:hypothetical protein
MFPKSSITTSNISPLVDRLVGWLGGAFGRGFDRKIEAAHRFLVLNFDPDDEIYILGFGRGAYSARSLCGLIGKCGIVRRDCFSHGGFRILCFAGSGQGENRGMKTAIVVARDVSLS